MCQRFRNTSEIYMKSASFPGGQLFPKWKQFARRPFRGELLSVFPKLPHHHPENFKRPDRLRRRQGGVRADSGGVEGGLSPRECGGAPASRRAGWHRPPCASTSEFGRAACRG